MRLFLLALALLVVAVAPATEQPTPLSGKWKVSLRTFVEVYSLTADISQDGKQVSGNICGNVRCYPISGVASGRNVEVRWQLEFWKNLVTVILTGVVDGNRITGSGNCGGYPCDWTGNRVVAPRSETAVEKKQAPIPKASITGKWRFEIKTEDAISYPVFHFLQKGDVITGSCRASFGETQVAGTVGGSQVRFSVRVARLDGDATITYTGVADGSSMSGAIRLGENRWGTWTAKRFDQ